MLFCNCSPVINKFYAIYRKKLKFKAEYPDKDIEEIYISLAILVKTIKVCCILNIYINVKYNIIMIYNRRDRRLSIWSRQTGSLMGCWNAA